MAPGQTGPTPFGEPLEGTGQNEAKATNGVVFSQHEVRREVVGGPSVEQRGSRRAEFVEKITEFESLLHIERNSSHEAGVYGQPGIS